MRLAVAAVAFGHTIGYVWDDMARRLTLTFDNGPWPGVTEYVLDLLAARGVHATFFVVGQNLRAPGARALAQRAVDEGHWIGNHTLTHSVQLGEPGADAQLHLREIGVAQDLVADLAHPHRLYRPYGAGGVLSKHLLSPIAVQYLCAGGYTCVLWSSVPRDWEPQTDWVARCLADVEAQEWPLVVLHDLPGCAPDRLPLLLDRLADEGVDIVQEFPEACVPIRCGLLTQPIDHLINRM
jgi:peptidoglycan/xylan/chitin deacetylase (PgdA/CDA1 family)